MEAETRKTQSLKHSVVVMNKARRELAKATANIEEVLYGSAIAVEVPGVLWCSGTVFLGYHRERTRKRFSSVRQRWGAELQAGRTQVHAYCTTMACVETFGCRR